MARGSRYKVLLLTALTSWCFFHDVSIASAEVRVELLTFAPGEEIWSRYGHSGIRVTDTESGMDVVFNYGNAPFGRPDFIWGFLRGRAQFYLAVASWRATVAHYIMQDRTIIRQPLNLSADQTRELARFLRWNAQAENRDYFYNHFFDNCSTRVRDALDEFTDGAVSDAARLRRPGWTFRDQTLAANAGNIAYLIALDLGSGSNQDEQPTAVEELFLPMFLMAAVTDATNVINGQTVPLAQPATIVFRRRGDPPQSGSRLAGRRVVILVGLSLGALLLGLGWVGTRPRIPLTRLWGRVSGTVLLLIGLVFGVIGTLFFVLGIVSKIPDTHWNENALVFWPIDFWLVGTGLVWIVKGRAHLGPKLKIYLVIRLITLAFAFLLTLVGLLAQDNTVWIGFVVLVLLGLRARADFSPKQTS